MRLLSTCQPLDASLPGHAPHRPPARCSALFTNCEHATGTNGQSARDGRKAKKDSCNKNSPPEKAFSVVIGGILKTRCRLVY